MQRLLGKPEVAHAVLGAIQSADTRRASTKTNRGELGQVLLVRQRAGQPEFPAAQVRTPALLACDAADEALYMEERFGPISFVGQTADTAASLALCERLVSQHGALTVGVYSTREESSTPPPPSPGAARWRCRSTSRAACSSNQSAAFSDYHGTGGNPAANAAYANSAFVANRFCVVQRRRHV